MEGTGVGMRESSRRGYRSIRVAVLVALAVVVSASSAGCVLEDDRDGDDLCAELSAEIEGVDASAPVVDRWARDEADIQLLVKETCPEVADRLELMVLARLQSLGEAERQADADAAEMELERQAEAEQQTSTPRSTVRPFASCSTAREAGAAPLYQGEPGYSETLDRDGDGIACED